MPKRKVTDETIAKIQHLRRRGKRDSEIGRELGLDRRTVKAAVEHIGKVLDQEHWQTISRQIDAEILVRHYGDLMRLAIGIQEQIGSDDNLTSNPDFAGHKCIELSFAKVFGHDWSLGEIERGSQFAHHRVLEPLSSARALALGNRLLGGLREHEPELLDAIEAWEQTFDRLQMEKGQLRQEAGASLRRAGLDQDMAKEAGMWLGQEVCQRTLNNADPGFFQPRPRGDSGIDAVRIIGDKEFLVFSGNEPEVAGLCESYESVLKSLIKSDKLKGIRKEAFEDLPKWGEAVDGLVDMIILRGRPNGRCALCPYALL